MQKESQGTMTGGQRRYDGLMGDDNEQQPEGMLAGTMSKVQDGVEGGKDTMAGGIESAADMMRDKMPGGDGMVGKAGTKSADTLEKTAGYLRDHESGELWSDVEKYVKDHPASALVGALAAGFVLSRILR
jgi:uncharacterized protein YjbJ (UPF0337 family)